MFAGTLNVDDIHEAPKKPARKPKAGVKAGAPHAVAEHCHRLLKRRAITAAAASVVPVPGLGVALDVLLLGGVINDINHAFGLTPAQIKALPQGKRTQAFNLIQISGNYLIGKAITAQLVTSVLKVVGLRVATKRVARFVPIVGQAASAALGYAITVQLGKAHIADCLKLAQQLHLTSNVLESGVEDIAFTERT